MRDLQTYSHNYWNIHVSSKTLSANITPIKEPTHASEYEALQVPLGKEMLVPVHINSG